VLLPRFSSNQDHSVKNQINGQRRFRPSLVIGD
jgi:hypothetical protein